MRAANGCHDSCVAAKSTSGANHDIMGVGGQKTPKARSVMEQALHCRCVDKGVFMKNRFQITEYCHHFLEEYISEGDCCIDATAGNGNDTEFLCQRVGKTGKVYAFDIQKEAMEHTRARRIVSLQNSIWARNCLRANCKADADIALTGSGGQTISR